MNAQRETCYLSCLLLLFPHVCADPEITGAASRRNKQPLPTSSQPRAVLPEGKETQSQGIRVCARQFLLFHLGHVVLVGEYHVRIFACLLL